MQWFATFICYVYVHCNTSNSAALTTVPLLCAILYCIAQVGEKQRALETLQAETADNNRLIAELQSALEGAETERDLLAEKLLDLEHSIEQRVVDRIAVERNKAKELGLTIESLKTHHAENLEHYQQLEVTMFFHSCCLNCNYFLMQFPT